MSDSQRYDPLSSDLLITDETLKGDQMKDVMNDLRAFDSDDEDANVKAKVETETSTKASAEDAIEFIDLDIVTEDQLLLLGTSLDFAGGLMREFRDYTILPYNQIESNAGLAFFQYVIDGNNYSESYFTLSEQRQDDLKKIVMEVTQKDVYEKHWVGQQQQKVFDALFQTNAAKRKIVLIEMEKKENYYLKFLCITAQKIFELFNVVNVFPISMFVASIGLKEYLIKLFKTVSNLSSQKILSNHREPCGFTTYNSTNDGDVKRAVNRLVEFVQQGTIPHSYAIGENHIRRESLYDVVVRDVARELRENNVLVPVIENCVQKLAEQGKDTEDNKNLVKELCYLNYIFETFAERVLPQALPTATFSGQCDDVFLLFYWISPRTLINNMEMLQEIMNDEYWGIFVPEYLKFQQLITEEEADVFFQKRKQGEYSISSNIPGWAVNSFMSDRFDYIKLAQRQSVLLTSLEESLGDNCGEVEDLTRTVKAHAKMCAQHFDRHACNLLGFQIDNPRAYLEKVQRCLNKMAREAQSDMCHVLDEYNMTLAPLLDFQFRRFGLSIGAYIAQSLTTGELSFVHHDGLQESQKQRYQNIVKDEIVQARLPKKPYQESMSSKELKDGLAKTKDEAVQRVREFVLKARALISKKTEAVKGMSLPNVISGITSSVSSSGFVQDIVQKIMQLIPVISDFDGDYSTKILKIITSGEFDLYGMLVRNFGRTTQDDSDKEGAEDNIHNNSNDDDPNDNNSNDNSSNDEIETDSDDLNVQDVQDAEL